MKAYYNILNVPKDADKSTIKKAYFMLVRKFPPDRYPTEFMDIREAYEVLIDENARKQFDLTDTMPDIARAYFDESKKRLGIGDIIGSIKLLEKLRTVYPDFSMVNCLLGDAYMENENSGKAIQIFEQLVADEPMNAGYVGKLAHAYSLRGWYKKAISRYKEALNLDEDNISLWLGYIKNHMDSNDFNTAKKIILKGIMTSQKNGWDSIELYFYAVQIDIMTSDQVAMLDHLDEIKQLALNNEEESSNVAWFLATLSQTLMYFNCDIESLATIQTAIALQPNDEEIKSIKLEIEKKNSKSYALNKFFDDAAVNDHIKAIIEFETIKCDDPDCENCEYEQFAYEMDVVYALEIYRKDILYLKNEYPELYYMKREFFDRVINKRDEIRLVNSYSKKLIKMMKKMPHKFEEDIREMEDHFDEFVDEKNTPFVRAEAKIGRNDPCPCGSGKKYKKCCGA
jgi:preprotein translocase subunit SecA